MTGILIDGSHARDIWKRVQGTNFLDSAADTVRADIHLLSYVQEVTLFMRIKIIQTDRSCSVIQSNMQPAVMWIHVIFRVDCCSHDRAALYGCAIAFGCLDKDAAQKAHCSHTCVGMSD